MIIDTHCHFDMMALPEEYIEYAERRGDIILGMTNLPSHFQMGYSHVCKYKHISLSLGFHPQLASDSKSELISFNKYLDKTSYIGEIGLDFSRESIDTKDEQVECLRYILSLLRGQNKIVSVHSRKAEKELLQLLKEYHIKNVIFHWYSGPVSLIKDIVNEGYYFSINEAMTISASGQKIIAAIPQDRILTETDAPYNNKTSIRNVLSYLEITEATIYQNFKRLIGSLGTTLQCHL